MSTSIGYLVPCILASTAYIASRDALIAHKNQEMPINLYVLFVGPPSTGKSQALKHGSILPMSTLIENHSIDNFMMDKCTSSGLISSISTNKEGFVVSPELFDMLNKLLKSDEDNATGDAQLLCELFSGERVSYTFASERVREIEPNVPFSIVGATQVPFAAKLIARLDQGHGLLDRFLILFPPCYRPTVEETDAALDWLRNHTNVESIKDIFIELSENVRKANYKFTYDAQQLLHAISMQEIEDINEALKQGLPVPKCKRCDLIKRLAVSLQIFNHVATYLLNDAKPPPTPEMIGKVSVEGAQRLLNYANTQKQIATEFINDIVSSCTEKETKQPSKLEQKTAILMFPGPITTSRSFKQYAPRSLRSVSEQEFQQAAKELDAFGTVVSIRVPRSTKSTIVFIKKHAHDIDWDQQDICQKDQYTVKYNLPVHTSIPQGVRNQLTNAGHVPEDFFNH